MSGNRIHRLRLRLGEVSELCVSHGNPKPAAKLSIVVVSMLVLINQWEASTGQEAINWFKVALTYCVPYVVKTYWRSDESVASACTHLKWAQERLTKRFASP